MSLVHTKCTYEKDMPSRHLYISGEGHVFFFSLESIRQINYIQFLKLHLFNKIKVNL